MYGWVRSVMMMYGILLWCILYCFLICFVTENILLLWCVIHFCSFVWSSKFNFQIYDQQERQNRKGKTAMENLHKLRQSLIHTCIHAYMHTCIHAYMHTCMHTCIHAYMHAYMHTCIHAYIVFYIPFPQNSRSEGRHFLLIIPLNECSGTPIFRTKIAPLSSILWTDMHT